MKPKQITSPSYSQSKDLISLLLQGSGLYKPYIKLIPKIIQENSLLDANALMDSTERLEYEESSILNKVIKASHQEKVVRQHL